MWLIRTNFSLIGLLETFLKFGRLFTVSESYWSTSVASWKTRRYGVLIGPSEGIIVWSVFSQCFRRNGLTNVSLWWLCSLYLTKLGWLLLKGAFSRPAGLLPDLSKASPTSPIDSFVEHLGLRFSMRLKRLGIWPEPDTLRSSRFFELGDGPILALYTFWDNGGL